MPILVHLTDERNTSAIRRNGLKIPKGSRGLYCMPVLPDFYVSHQWLRELKRNGASTFVGVYFRLNSQTTVYAGRYNQPHQSLTLGEAIREIMTLGDPLGYELILDRKIQAGEISRIKNLPQKIGWRYMPHSHAQKPYCTCSCCIPLGSINSRRLKNRLAPPERRQPYDKLMALLNQATEADELQSILWEIGKRTRRADPAHLLFLLDQHSDAVNRALATLLRSYKHQNTKPILLELLSSPDADTKESAAESLLTLYRSAIKPQLIALDDPIINGVVGEWV